VPSLAKKGTAKEKAKFKFYKEITESGQPPRVIQRKEPAKKVKMDIRTLTEFPGDWRAHWEGEPEALWEERLELGLMDWTRLIDGQKDSKKVAVQTQYKFYIQLTKEGRSPTPIVISDLGVWLETGVEFGRKQMKI
jgi:hypothetical protein